MNRNRIARIVLEYVKAFFMCNETMYLDAVWRQRDADADPANETRLQNYMTRRDKV